MYLTRYTDYSLRVLLFVALKDSEISTIREISESYDISKNHLMKIVQNLTNNGYLIALRGKNGGLRLNGRPEEINIGALMRELEQDHALVECFSHANTCVITPVCQLKHVLAEALESFFKTMDQYSLADLLPRTRQIQLTELLQISGLHDKSRRPQTRQM